MDEEKQATAGDFKLAGVVNGSELNDDSPQEIYIDPELEQRVMRKFDKFVLPQFAILVLIAYLDRSNIGTSFLSLISHITLTVIPTQAMPSCSVLKPT